MLALYIRLADRWHPHRWRFVATAVVAMGAMVLSASTLPFNSSRFTWGPLGAVCFVSWGLFLMCHWFRSTPELPMHPFRRALRAFNQWYAAVFLTVFLLFGTFVWPWFVLRHAV